MRYKQTLKFVIYLLLGFVLVPLITSFTVTISGGVVGLLLSTISKYAFGWGLTGVLAIVTAYILAIIGFFLLWDYLTGKIVLSASRCAVKLLGISIKNNGKIESLEYCWVVISSAASVIAYVLVGLFFFFEGLRPGPPEPGSTDLSLQAKRSIIYAYKECAVQLAMGENNGGLNYPNFTKPNVDNYVFYPEDGSCLGDKAGNISARSNNDELNPSFSVNPQSGHKSCSYEGKGKEKHGCVDGGW